MFGVIFIFTYISDIVNLSKMNKKLTVSDFLDELVLKGQYHFTLKEIEEALSIKESSLSVSLSRLAAKGKVKMIRKGFGIITGHTLGTLHPSYFINAMMAHLESRYYVGLLSSEAEVMDNVVSLFGFNK